MYAGVSDSRSLERLAAGCRLYVQGIVSDRERAESLRKALQASAAADRASVVWRRTEHLPYLDDLANLIVAENWGQGELQRLALSEIVRVLQPGGVAVVGSDSGKDVAALLAEAGKLQLAAAKLLPRKGAWIKVTKRMDPRYGEWPDCLGGPAQTMVSTDLAVEAGREVRWVNGPTWSTAAYTNDVFAGGRCFHMEKDWIKPKLGQWAIVARNAHNGCELWREDVEKPTSREQNWVSRSLCADAQRVYYNDTEELIARDAATGKLLTRYGPRAGSVTCTGAWLLVSGGALETAALDKESGKPVVRRACYPYQNIHPAAIGNVMYILRRDKNLSDVAEAIELPGGKSLWITAINELAINKNRVSVAPAYYRGLCLFGDHAGWVYCVEAATGRLVWQFQAAPEQKMMSAFNQFESAWPVKSGVLVVQDRAYFVAGRSGTMDGGLYFYSVDPLNGHLLDTKNINDTRPADLLVSDGRAVILCDEAIYMPAEEKGSSAPPAQNRLHAGQTYHGKLAILNMLDLLEPGKTKDRKRALMVGDKTEGSLIAFDRQRILLCWHQSYWGLPPPVPGAETGKENVICTGASAWVRKDTAQQMQALLLSGQQVYCAGIPEFRDSREPALLWVLSVADGQDLQKIPLDSAPAIDGLSAVGGNLLLKTVDGQVLCFGAP